MSINPPLQLFEERSSSFRHDYYLPFYFEVKSLQEKRLSDENAKMSNRSEESARRNEELNEKMLNYIFILFGNTSQIVYNKQLHPIQIF